MVPPWVPDPLAPNPLPVPPQQPAPLQPQQSQPPPTAPKGRFRGARLHLGNFAHSGDQRELRRGLRDYVRSGYGGRATVVRRFGGTVATADALHGALSAVAVGRPAAPGSALDPALLAGRSARDVIDAVVEAVRPPDGTQDAEASRAAIRDALSELLTMFPDADLLNLTDDQRAAVIERFVALDVFRRTALDVGKIIQDRAPTATAGAGRLKEVKEYIKQTVAAAFRKLRNAGNRVTAGRVAQVVRDALVETFHVFEAYIR
jgi:hypothetical protein